MAGQDLDRAADLIEVAAAPLRQARQEATLHRWLDALPDELFAARPVLSIARVGVLMAAGQVEGVEALLRDAEHWLDVAAMTSASADGQATAVLVLDHREFDRLPTQIAMYQVAVARILDDVVGTIEHATR